MRTLILRGALAGLALLGSGATARLVAQDPGVTDSIRVDPVPLADTLPSLRYARPTNIKLWQVGIGLAAAGLTLETLDAPVRRWAQRQRSSTTNDVANVFRQGGEPQVYLGVGGLVAITGLVTHNDNVTRSGGRLLASVVLAQALTQASKRVLGRERPFVSGDEKQFHLFSGGDASMPSGHATAAFALATAASNELHSTPASIAFYTVAAGTAWSRLNDDQHWLSDVLVGGAIGVVSAQFIYGKWTIFGIQPPRFLLSPRGASIGWSGTF